jgi:hypothetical protein
MDDEPELLKVDSIGYRSVLTAFPSILTKELLSQEANETMLPGLFVIFSSVASPKCESVVVFPEVLFVKNL